MRNALLSSILLLSLGLQLNACGSSRFFGAKVLSEDELLVENQNAVHAAWAGALHGHRQQNRYAVNVRYNPTPCGAPAWEAALYGRWQRVELVPTPTSKQRNMERLWLIRSDMEAVTSPSGWRYPSFYWEALPSELLER